MIPATGNRMTHRCIGQALFPEGRNEALIIFFVSSRNGYVCKLTFLSFCSLAFCSQVCADIVKQLGMNKARLLKTSFNRPNIHLSVRYKVCTRQRKLACSENVKDVHFSKYLKSPGDAPQSFKHIRQNKRLRSDYHRIFFLLWSVT